MLARFFKSVDPVLGAAEWIARNAEPMWWALPEPIVMDWDSTVQPKYGLQPKYGHQQGAEVGYNPGKPGRRSFHPLLGMFAHTRLCPVYRFRAGDTVTATAWEEAMRDTQRWLGERNIWLNRGDLGLGHDAIMSWHEAVAERPKYLFKLKLTNLVRSALCRVREDAWQGSAAACQVAEGRIQLTGWKTARRVIFTRTLLGVIRAPENAEFWDRHKHEFAVYVTNLPASFNP